MTVMVRFRSLSPLERAILTSNLQTRDDLFLSVSHSFSGVYWNAYVNFVD